MRLKRLRIGRFRNGRDLQVSFAPRDDADPALSFLVGPNGAGKSRVLEVIGRIFSHLSSVTPVGLDYDIEYEVGGKSVLIATKLPAFGAAKARVEEIEAWVAVAEPGEQWRPAHLHERLPDLDLILPFRVIGLSTGPTSRLDWALRKSLHDTLAQRMAATLPAESAGELEAEVEDSSEKQRLMRLTEAEERCVALSQDALVLAVLALLSHPTATKTGDTIREELLQRANLGRRSLRAFSLGVSPDWRVGLQGIQQRHFEDLLGKATRRLARDVGGDEVEAVDRRQRAVFELEPKLQKWIGQTADSPFVWFSQLLRWLHAGAIESVHLILQKQDRPGLLLDYDFSDGEFLYTGRYGLLRLLQGSQDCLVLFDEPETHFNDRWKVDLVYDLERVLAGTSSQVLIATHSDLTLSDADRSDVLMLDGDVNGPHEEPGQPPLSPLAADRGEITRQVFGAERGSGRRGLEIVEQALESGSEDDLKEALDRVGPGFHRFRLQYALNREEADDP